MSWIPDLAIVRAWGPPARWPAEYFEWLRGVNPLPLSPVRSSVHRMFHPMWDMLQHMRDAPDETLEAFYAGKISNLMHFDFYEAPADDQAGYNLVEYRRIIDQMLSYTGPINEALIDKYEERLLAATPYMGPMA